MHVKTLNIRALTLGAGREWLVCPITAPDMADALICARSLARSHADAAEFRADLSCDNADAARLRDITRLLRAELGDMPLMFTYRTEGADNPPALDADARRALIEGVITDGAADIVDVEHNLPGAARLIALAHERGVASIYSLHDFSALPEDAALAEFVAEARAFGADIAKFACMVRTREELLRLLTFTERTARDVDAPLLAAVPMGEAGAPGRLMAGLFGSCMSFCAYGAPSAPGQIELERAYRAICALRGEGLK